MNELDLVEKIDDLLFWARDVQSRFPKWSPQWCYHQGQIDAYDALSNALTNLVAK